MDGFRVAVALALVAFLSFLVGWTFRDRQHKADEERRKRAVFDKKARLARGERV